MRIVILGSGNVATVLGKAIKNAGHEVLQVYDRSVLKAIVLANELASVGIDNWQQISLEADIYLMALSDGAIPEVAKKLRLQKGILVHTAGAVSKIVLQYAALHYGVLYPLQSLRKEKTAYENIPLLVDGSSADTIETIVDFANTITSFVAKATDEQRLKLHVAAVVVSNFTNYLYGLAEDYCQKEHVPFAMLQPLIGEVAQRLQNHHAAEMQTGPAIRKDLVTIEKHTELLRDYADLQEVYTFISKKIMEM
jgi:predicted short-subunit dehydrogenase-like oxidoreductase (DUF2520 family)